MTAGEVSAGTRIVRRGVDSRPSRVLVPSLVNFQCQPCHREGVGEGEMNQVNARHEIIREWRSLPKEQRQTDEQAAGFAMQIKDKYKFSNESADPYQTVKGWLLSYRSLTRGLE